MKNLLFLGILACSVGLRAAATPYQTSPSDQQQQLREQGRTTLQSAHQTVKSSDEKLDTKVTAHQILARELGGSMPGDLVEGLSRELKVLQVLKLANPQMLDPIIDDVMSLIDGRHQVSIADVEKKIQIVDGVFNQLDLALASNRESRQAFKKRLNGILDAMTAANPGKAGTYLRLRTELDPDILDLEFATQKLVLVSVVVVLNSLK
jgi:hypothetical protein